MTSSQAVLAGFLPRKVTELYVIAHNCLCRPLQESINTGPFMMRSTCRRCGGKGSIVNTPCALCRGSGQTKKRQTVTVPVPAGTFSHTRHLFEKQYLSVFKEEIGSFLIFFALNAQEFTRWKFVCVTFNLDMKNVLRQKCEFLWHRSWRWSDGAHVSREKRNPHHVQGEFFLALFYDASKSSLNSSFILELYWRGIFYIWIAFTGPEKSSV